MHLVIVIAFGLLLGFSLKTGYPKFKKSFLYYLLVCGILSVLVGVKFLFTGKAGFGIMILELSGLLIAYAALSLRRDGKA